MLERKQDFIRRDFLKASSVIAGGLLLSACTDPKKNIPVTATNIATKFPTETTTPTPTSTETPTPTPEARVDGLHYLDNVPSPKELESGDIQGFDKYLNAFETSHDEVFSRLEIRDWLVGKDGEEKQLKDAKGNPLVVVVDKETQIPLLYAKQNEEKVWKWNRATLRDYAELNDMIIESIVGVDGRRADPINEIVNKIVIAGAFDMTQFFRSFGPYHWDKVLENWDEIITKINKGEKLSEFTYNKVGLREMTEQVEKYNVKIRAQHLLYGIDVPASIRYGGYTHEEIEKLAEFTVKFRVNEYKDMVETWDIADEVVNSHYYGGDTWNFWMVRLGGYKEMTLKVARWVKEVDPNAKLVVNEDNVLDNSFPQQPFQRRKFIELLEYLKENGVEDVGVVVENNLWIFDPPTFEGNYSVRSRLKEILEVGYPFVGGETTIVVSDDYPSWGGRPKSIWGVEDRYKAQEEMYVDLFQSYLDVGIKAFGFGVWADAYAWQKLIGSEDSDPCIFDDNAEPKKVYYRLIGLLNSNLIKNS
ncbi:endo-1,4-beta-xylanase [Patescibacteria group bacterium]|nr:endo-1,4-beta-xylanase [Patescibacteria group bacterium]MBU0777255.1 endo-1,4-beta-xylanase [Patescibacteria group bacterium]MBU0845700.1 endo-1,4-beta-xylanase [Patescibacteria group bacterium]MBU0923067.1 endo-1,4-beta-xylanase [Patescibacteria group bacterium]MBU1066620.1 endo-1,4-beta-xylanase [Patescibacteria group bacterium]